MVGFAEVQNTYEGVIKETPFTKDLILCSLNHTNIWQQNVLLGKCLQYVLAILIICKYFFEVFHLYSVWV